MKYLKHINEHNSRDRYINWNLIKDVKDMSLEYLDDGMQLNIVIYNVFNDNTVDRIIYHYIFPNEKLYTIYFSHELDHTEYHNWRLKECDYNIKYAIQLVDPSIYSNERMNAKKSYELLKRLREAYPEETIGLNI